LRVGYYGGCSVWDEFVAPAESEYKLDQEQEDQIKAE
jgi:hypothetical protein